MPERQATTSKQQRTTNKQTSSLVSVDAFVDALRPRSRRGDRASTGRRRQHGVDDAPEPRTRGTLTRGDEALRDDCLGSLESLSEYPTTDVR